MLVLINEVTLCWAQVVLGFVTGPGFNSWCGKPISVCNQPLRSTQTGHFFVDRHNEMSTDQRAVMLCSWGVKAGMVRGQQIKLCYPLANTDHN